MYLFIAHVPTRGAENTPTLHRSIALQYIAASFAHVHGLFAGVADITISHIISNDVPKYAYEIAAAHKEVMEAAGNVPASTITGGTFGADWMLVEMWASGIIQDAAPEVEIR